VSTHLSGADAGTSGISSSSSERSVLMRGGDGTAASSAKERWMPRPASWVATVLMNREGMRTITPTSGWVVLTCVSGCTSRNFPATAVTSSVDSIHEATPSSSTS
jgi:hypothetical protein